MFIEPLLRCLNEEIETDDDHIMEKFEELRRCLDSFLKPEVLQSLLDLNKSFGEETQQFHWFSRNSTYGRDCKYAIAAVKVFKRERLDRIKGLLKECSERIEEL